MKKGTIKTFIIINIILYLVVVLTWISIPDELTLNISTTLFSLVLTTIILLVKKDTFLAFSTSSRFKYLVNTGISAFLIFCILGMINFLAFKYVKQVDLTRNSNNTLSEQTRTILKSLKGGIAVRIFAKTIINNMSI